VLIDLFMLEVLILMVKIILINWTLLCFKIFGQNTMLLPKL